MSLFLDGVDDLLSASHISAYNITGDISILAWTKRTSSTDYSAILAKSNGSLFDYDFYFDSNAPDKLSLFSTAAASQNVVSSGSVPLGDWAHVAYVKTGTTYRFYINGVQSGTDQTYATATFGSNTIPLEIGRDGAWSAVANYWGFMAYVTLVNAALTTTQIQTHMVAPLPLPFANVVACFDMQSSANPGRDMSSNANHATVTGALYIANDNPKIARPGSWSCMGMGR